MTGVSRFAMIQAQQSAGWQLIAGAQWEWLEQHGLCG
jgi:hypothetical protein